MRTDLVRKYADKAAKIRRSKRQSKKNFVVYYDSLTIDPDKNAGALNQCFMMH